MEMPLISVSLSGLVKHVEKFVEYKGYTQVNVLGNSLGGHISLLFAISKPGLIQTITLTGSSGLFENAFGSTFPKRGDYEFIKRKTESTFYKPEVATQELIDEVYNTVNDRNKGLRIVKTAKSAVRHNLGDKLHVIKAPTLLVWGQNDTITPPFVAEQFDELIENTELHLVEECGHAPMMEHPKIFNSLLEDFLDNQGLISASSK
jgi:pimeloyl-ACP methyl ester carboxylesterase